MMIVEQPIYDICAAILRLGTNTPTHTLYPPPLQHIYDICAAISRLGTNTQHCYHGLVFSVTFLPDSFPLPAYP